MTRRQVGDVRECFISVNLWGQAIPCPRCLPGWTLWQKPPASGNGVARLGAQDVQTGQYLYRCSCGWEGNTSRR
jgi:hypothetical protein